MASMKTGDKAIDALYAAREGKVEFVDVPEMGFVVVEGTGAPGGEAYVDAIQALYPVSYGAHFAVKKALGEAPRVMPLETLWWVEGVDAQATMERIAAGEAGMDESDRDHWRWKAIIAQLPPIDAEMIERAVAEARAKRPVASLDVLRYERWAEGPSAQCLHVGPYSAEAPTIVALHKEIAERGCMPHGRHHEIYLGDPRKSAPEKLRTIIRQPVESMP